MFNINIISAILCLILIVYYTKNTLTIHSENYLDIHTNNKLVLVVFATNNFKGPKNILIDEAKKSKWFTDIEIWDEGRLQKECPDCLASSTDWVQNNPKGYGYWSWKTCILKKMVNDYHHKYPNQNVTLTYLDAGCGINRKAYPRLKQYIQMVQTHGGLTFELGGLTNKAWCKANTLQLINPLLADASQLVGGIVMFDVHSEKARDAIDKWKHFVHLDNGKFVMDPSPLEPQCPEFQAHRHDQSIWSLIARDYNFKIIPDESWEDTKKINAPFWALRRR